MAAPLGIELGATYELISPLGDRAVINDRDDPDFVGFIVGDNGVTGLGRAGLRTTIEDLPGADGATAGPSTRRHMPFTLSGIIEPDAGAAEARQDRLLRATDAPRADALLRWVSSSAGAVQVRFREQQETRILGRRPKTFFVAGAALDPFVYSQARHVLTIQPEAPAEGGFGSPLTSPLESAPGAAGVGVAHNAGRSPTWPRLTWRGPSRDLVIANRRLNRLSYFNYTLAAEEFLVIDTHPARRGVYLNGVARRYRAYDYTRSAWWPIMPGNNEIWTGYAAHSEGAKVTLEYRDAWG